VKHSEWLREHVQPKYEALFKKCNDIPLGEANRCKISKELVEWKRSLDMKAYKKYADGGKKYQVI
jgi:hypothetical protein